MILDAIIHGVSILLWILGSLLCELLDLVYDMFKVFAGMDQVTYYSSSNGKAQYDYILNVFFNNSTISKVYWGMAVIGVVMCGVFTAWAVFKKSFDSNEKVKNSYGGILTGTFKAILLMLLMTGIVTSTVSATNILMTQVNYVFDNADKLNKSINHTFTDDEYAAMFRILNTIGNYSLNLNYNSRYNINKCYNDIREDMQYLDGPDHKVFDFDYKYYVTKDKNGNYELDSNGEKLVRSMDSWQSCLSKIYSAGNIYEELSLDLYYPAIQQAITYTMSQMRNNAAFKPLPNVYYERVKSELNSDMSPGVIVMLASSIGSEYDEVDAPTIQDRARLPYFTGDKDIYSLDAVEENFNIDIGHGWNYIVMFLGAYFLIQEFAACLLNCVARIFNLILLYLVAPFALSTMPLDEGGKFKQWSTAFVIQSFSIFGTVIAIRVLMLFVPLIFSSNLVLFDNFIMNILGKIVLVLGAAMTSEKASSLITGILADNAGMQALSAGDIGNAARGAVQAAAKGVGGAALVGAQVAGSVAKGAATATGLTTAANAVSNKVGGAVKAAGNAMKDHGGIIGAIKHSRDEKKKAGGGADGAKGKDGDKGKGDKGKGDKGKGDKGTPDKKGPDGDKDKEKGQKKGEQDNKKKGDPKKEPPVPNKSQNNNKKDGK